MTYDATSRADIRALEKASRDAEVARQDVIKGLMSTTPGRKWVNDLLTQCHIGRNPFSPDALAMSYNCGEMNVGLQIWADIQTVCPDLYILMMRESNARDAADTARQQRRSKDRDGGDQAGSGSYDYSKSLSGYDDSVDDGSLNH